MSSSWAALVGVLVSWIGALLVATAITYTVPRMGTVAPASPQLPRQSGVKPTIDVTDDRTEKAFWARRQQEEPAPTPTTDPSSHYYRAAPENSEGRGHAFYEEDEGRGSAHEPTYRTVCVRLCDGYHFPIGEATPRSWLSRDENMCRNSCGSPARLFILRPGQEAEDMVDVKGTPYTQLDNAFRYRQKYDPACKCKPHPWEQEAKDRRRMYVLEEQARKGNLVAITELKTLRAKYAAATAPPAMPTPGVQEREQARLDFRNTGSQHRRGAPTTQGRISLGASAEPSERPYVATPSRLGREEAWNHEPSRHKDGWAREPRRSDDTTWRRDVFGGWRR